MQIRQSVSFFTKSANPSIFLFKSEIATTSGNRSVTVQRQTGKCEYAIVNSAQTVERRQHTRVKMSLIIRKRNETGQTH